MRKIILFGLLLASNIICAQTTDGLIISTADTEQQFAISEIKTLTFSDEGMTVVKTNDATIEFPADWTIHFGEVETTGITFATNTEAKTRVQIFTTDGKLVKESDTLSNLCIKELPLGTYIITFNGKSLKIQR